MAADGTHVYRGCIGTYLRNTSNNKEKLPYSVWYKNTYPTSYSYKEMVDKSLEEYQKLSENYQENLQKHNIDAYANYWLLEGMRGDLIHYWSLSREIVDKLGRI